MTEGLSEDRQTDGKIDRLTVREPRGRMGFQAARDSGGKAKAGQAASASASSSPPSRMLFVALGGIKARGGVCRCGLSHI